MSATNFVKVIALVLSTAGLMLPGAAVSGVDEDFSVWGAIQGQGSFDRDNPSLKNWQWWMEGQGRFSNDANRLGQSIIRPGIGYQLSETTSIWLGYGWILTRPLGRAETDEHRIWQQLNWKDSFSWGGLFSRTRLEQRFLSNGDDTGWRFRQFTKYTRPLKWERLYLSLWDEVFVNINTTDFGAESGFGQNRAFVGLGVFLDSDKHFRFELGYMNQFVANETRPDVMNHIISTNLFIRY